MKARKLITWGVLSLCLLVWHRSHAQRFVGFEWDKLLKGLNDWEIHLFYTTLFFALAWWFYISQLKRKLAEQETLRLKELDAMKSQLYANITHEFRTPLLLILGHVDQCLKQNPGNGNTPHFNKLQSVKNNGKRLLQLVNQLLDLRKLESGHVKMDWKNGDIILALKFIAESFRSMAEARHIELVFESNLPSLRMDFDSDKLLKIVTNLLSNALKFTPPNGKVVFFVQQVDDDLELQVKDNGEGILKEDLPHLFTRFYQANSNFQPAGTGIGLTLVKELVERLGGSISVQSTRHIGTVFTVRLPIRTDHAGNAPVLNPGGELFADKLELHLPPDGNFPMPDQKFSDTLRGSSSKPLILLAEDNREVAGFVASMLHHKYRIILAEDGEKGIEQALEKIPDLIVSDVMMPQKDGFELLRVLKNDERTSHIPIILLTAKVETEDRLEGIRHGADAYLEKPFQEEELLVHINQLLLLRKMLQKHYSSLDVTEQISYLHELPLQDFDLPMEDAFLQKVIRVIMQHHADPCFGVTELCRVMTLSPSQLHRKLTAITAHTPVQLIRAVRLAHAKVLLKKPDASISEVAYDAGFKDPAYFSRIFSKAFSLSPSEFKDSYTANGK